MKNIEQIKRLSSQIVELQKENKAL